MYTMLLAILILMAALVGPSWAKDTTGYSKETLVANKAKYKATFATDKELVNAWGVAIRPAGKGGHFWVGAADHSFEYVGDVRASSDEKLQKLYVDNLKLVKLPVGGKENVTTGVVFSDSKENFVVTQQIPGVEPVTAPAKFLFASDGGIISAWTERKKEDGSFDRADHADTVIDQSKDGAQFFGLAVNENYDRLYAADFGAAPAIKVFDGKFKPENITFDMPFDDNKNGVVDAGEYAPFNVQQLNGKIFVTYAKTQSCPKEEIRKKTCNKGELFVGEEDTSKPGQGRLAEFNEDGKLIAVWNDGGKLSAPWGLAFAPASFGAASKRLLVANFGDGTIATYNADTRAFEDMLKDANGKPIVIDKIWGLIFGNGESLGDKDALYFTSGPNDEKDGEFGVLRALK